MGGFFLFSFPFSSGGVESRSREVLSAHTYISAQSNFPFPSPSPGLKFPDKVIIDISATVILAGFWIMSYAV